MGEDILILRPIGNQRSQSMTSDRRSLTKRWLIIAGAIVFVLAVAIASLAIFRNFQDSEPKSNVHGFSEPALYDNNFRLDAIPGMSVADVRSKLGGAVKNVHSVPMGKQSRPAPTTDDQAIVVAACANLDHGKGTEVWLRVVDTREQGQPTKMDVDRWRNEMRRASVSGPPDWARGCTDLAVSVASEH